MEIGKALFKRKHILALTLAAVLAVAGLSITGDESVFAYPPGWTVQSVVDNNDSVSEFSVDVWDRYVLVAWRSNIDGSIQFQRSCDYGSTWDPPVKIEDGSTYGTGGKVKVMHGANATWVFYASNRNTGADGEFEIWIARSDDLGATWPTDTSTDPSLKTHRWHTGSANLQHQIDADSVPGANHIMFVYSEKRNGAWMEIKYGGYIDNGGNIKPAADVWLSSLNDQHSTLPAITCNGNADAVVVWQDSGPVNKEHKAICGNWTDDKGSSWNGSTVVLCDSNMSFLEPQIDWEENYPVVLFAGQNTVNGTWCIMNVYLNAVKMEWRGHDGSDPPTLSGSVVYNCGNQQPHPAIFGPWCYETWVFENQVNGGQISLFDGYTNPHIEDCRDTFGALTSTGHYGCCCAERRTIIGIAGEDGKIYLRRKDNVPPPDVQLTNPPTGQKEDTYVNGDFDMTCTAQDNLAITGSDMSNGYNYYKGIRRVRYEYTEDESTWIPIKCTTGDGGDGGYYADEPPYKLTAVGSDLAGKRIKIRACAEDSAGSNDFAGNIGYGISPGWILVDMEPPDSVISVNGVTGNNSFYTTFTSCTLSSPDPNTAKIQYKFSNSQGDGGTGTNWTTYNKAFTLTDGIWKVEHRAVDKAGNVGPVRSNTVKVDTKDPVCSITSPKRDTIQTGYYSDETFNLSGTGIDVNNLQWAGIFVDEKMVYQTTSCFEMSYVWSLRGITEGNHKVTVKSLDMAGNMGSASKNVWIGNAVRDWYFAEGNTLPEFDEYICLMNPGDTDALVQVQFMLENGRVINHERSMRPKQRDTVKVKDYVEEGRHVSTRVHCSEQAIIAERPMYFRYKNVWKGGHNAMGVNVLQKDWYFAEGTTRKNSSDGLFDEWITVMNPSENQDANVTITYMMGDGSNLNAYYSVAPHSRLTVEVVKDVGVDKDVSAKVSADIPIAAERPMYFNYHGYAVDGSDVVGTSGPSDTWYFAEGATHPGFQEWLTIQNPNDVDANCKVTYMTGSGVVTTFDKVVAPRSRGTVDVLSQVGDNENVSTRVESDVPVIAERPMYFIYAADTGKGWDGGEAAMGNPDPSTQYFLAEGCTITNFDTWYTLQNPRDDKGCKVTIEYCFGDGGTQNIEYWIEPHSRLTINVNDAVKRRGDVSGAITASFPIVIERPMYFNYNGITGGHDVVGFGVD